MAHILIVDDDPAIQEILAAYLATEGHTVLSAVSGGVTSRRCAASATALKTSWCERVKLFPRLFLSHLLVIIVALGALLLIAELLAPAFIRHHVEQMVALIGPNGASLRPDLERGVRGTLTSALIASVPLSLMVAALTALFSARRMMHSVALLRDGSHAIAAGEYTRRLPEQGQDELTDLARHFNRMASALEQVERGALS